MKPFVLKNIFGIEGLNVAWYGVILGIALVVGVLYAIHRAKMRGFKSDVIYDYILWTLPISIICARMCYVIFEWEHYRNHISKVFVFAEGGLSMYGAVLAGIVVAIIFSKKNKISFFLFADIAFPALVLGQIIGRWCDFVNQEAYGNIVINSKLQFFPYSVYIDRLGEWHQATFFYEVIWNVLLLCAILISSNKEGVNGAIVPVYLIGYGLGRFLIEGLRRDGFYLTDAINISQVISLLFILAGMIVSLLLKKRRDMISVYEGKYSLQKI